MRKNFSKIDQKFFLFFKKKFIFCNICKNLLLIFYYCFFFLQKVSHFLCKISRFIPSCIIEVQWSHDKIVIKNVLKTMLTIRERPQGPRKRRYRRSRRSWRRCRSGSRIPWRCPRGICSTFCNPLDGRVCWSCRMHHSLRPRPDTWNLRRPL